MNVWYVVRDANGKLRIDQMRNITPTDIIIAGPMTYAAAMLLYTTLT